eukprot:1385327-Amorphochlora_amoeboformis.AAC.1
MSIPVGRTAPRAPGVQIMRVMVDWRRRIEETQKAVDRKEALKKSQQFANITYWHEKLQKSAPRYKKKRQEERMKEEIIGGELEVRMARRAKLKDLLESEMIS